MSHVNQQIVTAKKVGTQDGFLHICEVQGEGVDAKGGDCSIIDSLQGEAILSLFPLSKGRGYHIDLCSGVH